MMLMNDIHSTDEMNCSNTLQQMQLFDLSRPKDITTFIEVEPDNCDDTNSTSNKLSGDEAKRAYPLSRKRKSIKENKSKIMKKPDFSTDKGEERPQIENVFNQLRSENTVNIQTVHSTHHFPVSNYTQRYFPLRTLTNRFEEYTPDQRMQADNNNFDQRQISNNNVNMVQITNPTSSTIPPWQTPVSSINMQNLNPINHGPNYALNVIIEHVLNFLMHGSQNNSRIFENRLQLFQRCYAYVVNYCLDPDMNSDYKVLNHIVLKVVSIAQNSSQYINQKQTRLLLDAMFEWCRQRRSIEMNMERSRPPPYNPPACNLNQLNSISIDQHRPTLIPQIQTISSQNNSNKSLQLNNEIPPAINKDQTCLFMLGTPGKEISINVDTSLYRTLQNKPETTKHVKLHQSVNIEERETPKIFQSPIETHSGMTTAFEIFTGQNIKIPEQKDSTSEIQIQTDITSRSSVSRDSGFISPSNVNNLEDRLISSVQQKHTNEELTPIITHVTSLNSNASYISKGLCSVCKKETNKRCIGCYKIYYCCRNCQVSEWYIHKILCNGTR